ncbi:hypothetical protein SRHO_G00212420 [Serrasalmus rhombeus]
MRMEENPVPTGPKPKKKNGAVRARAVRSVRVELGVKQRRSQGFFEREKRGIEHHVQVGSIGWRPKPRPLNLKFFCMQRIEPIDSKTRSPLALTHFTSQGGGLKLASPQSKQSRSFWNASLLWRTLRMKLQSLCSQPYARFFVTTQWISWTGPGGSWGPNSERERSLARMTGREPRGGRMYSVQEQLLPSLPLYWTTCWFR